MLLLNTCYKTIQLRVVDFVRTAIINSSVVWIIFHVTIKVKQMFLCTLSETFKNSTCTIVKKQFSVPNNSNHPKIWENRTQTSILLIHSKWIHNADFLAKLKDETKLIAHVHGLASIKSILVLQVYNLSGGSLFRRTLHPFITEAL